ncbi:hypothetical protein [Halopiger goleimassiliensis]|uniref:hypothetical protein n=1 Tax=Halopiger goleimassiliensis TaxID=1293048 RepID=UPI0012B533F0|nr:hypothetical protein [Halopiger goleimassiliensis]
MGRGRGAPCLAATERRSPATVSGSSETPASVASLETNGGSYCGIGIDVTIGVAYFASFGTALESPAHSG